MSKLFPTTDSILNPLEGQMTYDKLKRTIMIYNGTSWVNASPTINYCVMCKMSNWEHGPEDGHPFMVNNLEMLEYKYEQSQL